MAMPGGRPPVFMLPRLSRPRRHRSAPLAARGAKSYTPAADCGEQRGGDFVFTHAMTTRPSKTQRHSLSSSKRRGPAKPASGRTVNVGLTQMACSDDPRKNRANQVRLAEQAARQGAQVICTQELFVSQYFCQVEDHRFFKLAETIPGPSTDAL